jgi:hypothetical protein
MLNHAYEEGSDGYMGILFCKQCEQPRRDHQSPGSCKDERDCGWQPWCRIEGRCKRAINSGNGS